MSAASIRADGKAPRGENRERAAARAEVEHALDLLGRLDQAVLADNLGEKQLSDEAARHDDALVDVERHALDIGLVEQIGGGLAGFDARVDQCGEALALLDEKPRVGERIERVDRQMQSLEDQESGFVDRRVGPVPEGEISLEETADRMAEPVARGDEDVEARIEHGDCPSIARRVPNETAGVGAGCRAIFNYAIGSRALLALGDELFALLEMQFLGLGLLFAFLRSGGSGGGVRLDDLNSILGVDRAGDQYAERERCGGGGNLHAGFSSFTRDEEARPIPRLGRLSPVLGGESDQHKARSA